MPELWEFCGGLLKMTSAYLNALTEEGTRADLLREIGRLYDLVDQLRAALGEIGRLYDNQPGASAMARAALAASLSKVEK